MRKQGHKPDAPLRAICYHRCSTEEQDLEAQRRATELECEREGWTIADSIDDQGWSAKDTKRPGLQKALAMLANKEADVLVVAKLDRLSRSVYDFIGITEKAKSQGWDICIKDLKIDTTHPNGELVLTVLSAISQWERRMISLRTRESLDVKRSQGIVGGRRGMDAELAAQIVEWRKKGFTRQAICDALNEAGKPTPFGAKEWKSSSLDRLIQREGLVKKRKEKAGK